MSRWCEDRCDAEKAELRETIDELRAHIAELEAENAELEQALKGAVWVTNIERSKVMERLSLTPQQASVVVALYKTPRSHGLSYSELDQLLPPDKPNGQRWKDPDFRTFGHIKTQVHEIRRRAPEVLRPNRGDRWRGVQLTDEGRRLVGEALAS